MTFLKLFSIILKITIIIPFILTNAQVYERIPLWEVEHHILDFVHDNYLNNCYQHTEHSIPISKTKLKCMNNDILYDVNISIKTNNIVHDPYISVLV